MLKGRSRLRHLITSALVAVAALSVLGTSSEAEAQSEVTEAIELRPGDKVTLTVWGREEMSGTFEVTDEGGLAHPLMDDVRVTGRSFSEVREDFGRLLSEFDETPRYVATPRVQVAVFGEVQQASLYHLSPEMTVGEAVAHAGGFTRDASTEDIRVIRDGQEITVDMADARRGEDYIKVRSGDQIQVDRDRNVFREYIAPAGSITSALVGLVSLLTR